MTEQSYLNRPTEVDAFTIDAGISRVDLEMLLREVRVLRAQLDELLLVLTVR